MNNQAIFKVQCTETALTGRSYRRKSDAFKGLKNEWS